LASVNDMTESNKTVIVVVVMVEVVVYRAGIALRLETVVLNNFNNKNNDYGTKLYFNYCYKSY